MPDRTVPTPDNNPWPCPHWCTQDHHEAPARTFGHSTATTRCVPCLSGYGRRAGAFLVQTALTVQGGHVVLSDMSQDYCAELTIEAAEELGHGLLAAAALLRGASPAPAAVA